MEITTRDKIGLIFSIYSTAGLLQSLKKKVALFLRPLDAVRYVEFAYIIKFVKENNFLGLSILDISSPHMLAYYLSKNNRVLKTNIDSRERSFIRENKNLTYKVEDATCLSFPNDTFDLTYSVSVIEHIYEKYVIAISEMIRVTRSSGYLYITFPVSKQYSEEWLEGDVYEKQFKKEGKTFFQYRFNEEQTKKLLEEISTGNIEVISKCIFWERKEGAYDTLIRLLKIKYGCIYVDFFKDVVVNIWYGFTLFSKIPASDFTGAKSFGNMHLILRKK